MNFIAEVMIIVGSWNKYPFQVVIAVLGIVLTMAYLFKMMRGTVLWIRWRRNTVTRTMR